MDRLTELAYGAWTRDRGVELEAADDTLPEDQHLSLPERLVVSGALSLEEALGPLEGSTLTFICEGCCTFFDVPQLLAPYAQGELCPTCQDGPVKLAPGEEIEGTLAVERSANTLAGPAEDTGAYDSTLAFERQEERRIGPWIVKGRLGSGGSGEVFLVEGPEGEQAALKLLRAVGEVAEKRFLREILLLQRVESDYAVRYLSHGLSDEGAPYLVTSYVVGASLSGLLGSRTPPRLGIAEALHVLLGCCEGLAACHGAKLVHRDIKPSNVLIGIDGSVKVTDYGIALADNVTERLTAQNQIVGTPQYVAPELLSGQEPTFASDVYSLGALAWRILTGERPFPGASVVEVLGAQLEHVPASVSDLRPDVPSELSRLVAQTLAKDPAQRPSLEELRAFLSGTELRPETAEIAARWKEDLLDLARQNDDQTLAAAVGVKVGEEFLQYRIDRELGRGGMGVVYEAYHLRLRKRVAIKMLLTGALASERERARFLREAEAVAGLEHPAIVPVLDAGESQGTYYLTMDFVEGQTLTSWAEGLEQDRVLQTFVEICEGVHHAHTRGVIHRDLKPDNIMVDVEHHAHVLDFGIAKTKEEGDSASLTQDGSILGTLRYMAPEQARGAVREVDVRSDVYALGSVLYELLVGRTPFRGSLHEMLHQVVHVEPQAPRRVNPSLPWELEAIVLKALEKDPQRRYQSAMAFRQDVERYLGGRPIEARRATLIYRARKWVARNQARALGIAAAVLLALCAVAFGVQKSRMDAEARRTAIVGEVEVAFELYQARDFDGAAQTFGVAARSLALDESFPLPTAAAERAPEAIRLDLPADERAEPHLQRARLQRWADLALAGQRAKRVDTLIERAGATAEQGPIGDALLQLRLAEADAPGDRRLFPIQSRIGARFRREGLGALERELDLAEAGDNFAARREALDAGREALNNAESLGDKEAGAILDDLHQRRAKLLEAIRLHGARGEAQARLGRARELSERQALAALAPADARQRLHAARRELTIARDRWPEIPGGRAEVVQVALALGHLELEAGRLQLARVELETARLYPEVLRDAQHALELALNTQEREARSFERFREEAEKHFAARSFAKAAGLYGRAINALAPEDPRRARFKARRALATTHAHLARAEKRADLERVRRLLGTAISLSDNPADLQPRLREVEGLLYGQALERAHALTRAARQGRDTWQSAIEAYELALSYQRAGQAALRGRADAFAERDRPQDMVLVSVPLRLLAQGVEAAQVDEAAVLRFYLDRYEVSNQRFAEFVDAKGYASAEHWRGLPAERSSFLDASGSPGPRGWSQGQPPAGSEVLPVTGVSAPEAAAFARFHKRRLPREREWLLAACLDPATGQLRRFPWGDSVPAEERGGLRKARAVGSRAWDRSPWGALDMGFGASEWVEAAPHEFAIRGHSTHFLEPDLKLGARDWRKFPLPTYRHTGVGFRCALDVPAPPPLESLDADTGGQDR